MLVLLQIKQQVKHITGESFVVMVEGRRDGDPSILIASEEKAKKILELKTNFPSLEKIIKTMI